MAKFGIVTFKGASGVSYTFRAYSIETIFRELGAVYFITNRNVIKNELFL